MSDDSAIPSLLPGGELTSQATYMLNAIGGYLARKRIRRDREGRLATTDDEHAALQHDMREHPPVRLMSDAEQVEWQRRVPSELAAQQGDEAVTVWTAKVVDANGAFTGEWGLEAHAWGRGGGAAAAAFVVCRDAEDALAMARHLRAHGTAEDIGSLHELAVRGNGQFVSPAPVAQPAGSSVRLGRHETPLVLSESDWELALRKELPARLANSIIVKDPAHPHHTAWRELHALANHEVHRVGADPERLAKAVWYRPRWREDVEVPAALAHWAISKFRSDPKYSQEVTRRRHLTAVPPAPTEGAVADAEKPPARPMRREELTSPQEALVWAKGLDAHHPGHRLAAKTELGRWGDEVDGVLYAKYPGLSKQALAAADKKRSKRSGSLSVVADAAAVASKAADPEPEQLTVQEHCDRVAFLKKDNPFHRREALTMLDKVDVEVDRLIAEKFAADPTIVERLGELYPNGIPEAEAAAWRNRAQGADAAAAAEQSALDDPSTVRREDLDGVDKGRDERGVASKQRGVAASLAGERPEHLRRTTPQQSQRPARRSS